MVSSATEKDKRIEEVYRKVGPLGDESHDSEIIAAYAREFKYSPERKREVLQKLGAENDDDQT